MIRNASRIFAAVARHYETQGYMAALRIDSRKPVVQAIREEIDDLGDITLFQNPQRVIIFWGAGFARGMRERGIDKLETHAHSGLSCMATSGVNQ
jgi:hypothetical protein